MKTTKEEQSNQTRKNTLENNSESAKTNAAGKKITVGPQEYEEDLSMNIRMEPQPLGKPKRKRINKKKKVQIKNKTF